MKLKPDQQFPVAKGTVLSLTCEAGYQLEGDEQVTCVLDKRFTSTSNSDPKCGN